jgi:carbon storage regulator
MLILSRKIGERIRIGNGKGAAAIEVIVQRISGDRVSLGIAAPAHVKILRGELVLPDLTLASHTSADFTDFYVSEPAAVD